MVPRQHHSDGGQHDSYMRACTHTQGQVMQPAPKFDAADLDAAERLGAVRP